MNIFWLDDDPRFNAEYHCDKHVVKMCVEYVQLLSGAVRILAPNKCTPSFPYKLTHKNHPCAIWVRSSEFNYLRLRHLTFQLGYIFQKRYHKHHKSIEMLASLPDIGEIPFPAIEPTTRPLVMSEQCKIGGVVESYRKYYLTEKRGIATWKYSEKPDWWV